MSCEVCGTVENLQTHHISYKPEVTQILCVKHHKEVHGHGVGLPEPVTRSKEFKEKQVVVRLIRYKAGKMMPRATINYVNSIPKKGWEMLWRWFEGEEEIGKAEKTVTINVIRVE